MTSETLSVPRVTAQDTIPDVVQDILKGSQGAEDCWISCYLEGKPSVHGRIRVFEDDDDGVQGINVQGRDGVDVVLKSLTTLTVSCPALELKDVPVSFPSSVPFTLRNGIDCFDISPTSDSFVVGGKDGLLRVGNTNGQGRAVELAGHVADIRAVRFFPSGQVVLSASTDMSVRVFSAVDGTNPRTLTGHTKAVTCIDILGVGKQVVSGSSDCSVRIWTVGTSSCDKVIRFTSPVNDVRVAGQLQENETITLAVALSNGKAALVETSLTADETEPRMTFLDTSSPLTTIEANDELVVTGSRDGVVCIFDTTSRPPRLLEKLKRSSASITSLQLISRTELLVGSSEGLLCSIDIQDEQSLLPKQEYVSGDCDSLVGRKDSKGTVWSASQDGKLRSFQ